MKLLLLALDPGRGGDGDNRQQEKTADGLGHTILHEHFNGGSHHIEVLQLLLAAGADTNARDPDGRNVLWYATRSGDSEDIQLLIEHGARVNDECIPGGTALYAATESNRNSHRLAIVQLLLQNGANVDGQPDNLIDPQDVSKETDFGLGNARNPRHDFVVSIDAQRKALGTPLHLAVASCQDISLVRMLLDHGANPNAKRGELEESVISSIIPDWDPGKELIQLLLDYGAIDDRNTSTTQDEDG